MNTFRTLTTLVLALGLAAPAMAGSIGGFIDLPHLTFPPVVTPPATQGTARPLAMVPGH